MEQLLLDRNLALEAVRVTEIAAIASSFHMGRGNEKAADQAAVNAITGVTDGTLLNGVRITKNAAYTHSVVMKSETGTIRYINAKHDLNVKKYKSYFK